MGWLVPTVELPTAVDFTGEPALIRQRTADFLFFSTLCFTFRCFSSFVLVLFVYRLSLLREEISLKCQNAVFCSKKLVLVSYRNYNFAMLAMLCYNLNHQESAKIGVKSMKRWRRSPELWAGRPPGGWGGQSNNQKLCPEQELLRHSGHTLRNKRTRVNTIQKRRRGGTRVSLWNHQPLWKPTSLTFSQEKIYHLAISAPTGFD